jgi:hypothetical protein
MKPASGWNRSLRKISLSGIWRKGLTDLEKGTGGQSGSDTLLHARRRDWPANPLPGRPSPHLTDTDGLGQLGKSECLNGVQQREGRTGGVDLLRM